MKALLHTISCLLVTLSVARAQCAITGLSPGYCVNSPSVVLSATPPGGVLSGTALIAGVFSPSLAGVGTHTISYTYCSTAYSLETATYAPLSYSPTFVVLGDNAVSSALPIGFDFRFYCKAYNQFYISSNGFIAFTPPVSDGCCQGLAMPTGTVQNDMIACAWTDLDPTQGGTIRYALIGTAPTRSLLVSFNCIFHKTGQGPVTSEILLCETSNVIEIVTATKPIPVTTASYATTMGIQDGNGLALVVPGRNASATWTATGETLRFIPGLFCEQTVTTTVLPLPVIAAVASRTGICQGESTTLSSYGASSYTWSNASTQQVFAVSPSVTTVYTVTGKDSNGCSATATVQVKVGSCPGVDETEPASSLRAYPVPSSGDVTLESVRALTVVLRNGLGQLMGSYRLSAENGFRMQLGGLSPGLYFLSEAGKAAGTVRLLVLPRQ